MVAPFLKSPFPAPEEHLLIGTIHCLQLLFMTHYYHPHVSLVSLESLTMHRRKDVPHPQYRSQASLIIAAVSELCEVIYSVVRQPPFCSNVAPLPFQRYSKVTCSAVSCVDQCHYVAFSSTRISYLATWAEDPVMLSVFHK